MKSVKTFRGQEGSSAVVPTAFHVVTFGGYYDNTTPLGENVIWSGYGYLINYIVRANAWMSAIDWFITGEVGAWTGASLKLTVYIDRQDGEGEVVLFASPTVPPGADTSGGSVFAPMQHFIPEGSTLRGSLTVSGSAIGGEFIVPAISLSLCF